MATFVCARCLKDIHGEPVWERPTTADGPDAGDDAADCIAPNLPDPVPYHPSCVEKQSGHASGNTRSGRDD
jgi:hypothetical protein